MPPKTTKQSWLYFPPFYCAYWVAPGRDFGWGKERERECKERKKMLVDDVEKKRERKP